MYCLDGHQELARAICESRQIIYGEYEQRLFPDGEYYFRNLSNVEDADVWLLCSLNQPNSKFIKIIFMAEMIRQQGAKRVGLVSPYLGYMRQDAVFNQGEINTAQIFASAITKYIDKLITVDPHLHRILDLNEIYNIPAIALSAAETVASWIKANVSQPYIIGPDSESEQWVKVIAKSLDCGYQVQSKIRRGDYDVSISALSKVSEHVTPILFDDIISSGKTMLGLVEQFKEQPCKAPICICTHALFNESTYKELINAGASVVYSTNTIKHFSNHINLAKLIASELHFNDC